MAASSPPPAANSKNTDGWVERSKGFLVPEGAVTLVLMPTLFQAESGTYELDNFSLKPTDPAVLVAADDWPMYGHDVSRTNYNPDETTINAGNVTQLVQRWQVNVGSNGTGTSAAPSVESSLVADTSAEARWSRWSCMRAISGDTTMVGRGRKSAGSW